MDETKKIDQMFKDLEKTLDYIENTYESYIEINNNRIRELNRNFNANSEKISNLRKQIDRYKSKVENIDIVRSAFHRMNLSRVDSSKREDYTKIYNSIRELEILYGNTDNILQISKAFDKDIRSIMESKKDKIIQEVQLVKKLSMYTTFEKTGLFSSDKIGNHIILGEGDNAVHTTFSEAADKLEQMLLNERPYNITGETLLSKKENKDALYHSNLAIIEKYEEDSNIPRIKKTSPKGIVSGIRSFVNGNSVNTGRDAIMKITKSINRIDQINEVIKLIDSVDTTKEFVTTRTSLVTLLEKEKLIKEQAMKEFEQSDYKLIEQAVKNHRKKESEQAMIDEYSSLYARHKYLMENDPKNEEIFKIESDMAELSKSLDENDIRIAISAGEQKLMEMQERDIKKAADERMAKMIAEEEQRIIKTDTNVEPQTEDIMESFEGRSYKRAGEDFDNAITIRRELDKGIVSPEVSAITNREYYESTMGMTREERALHTMIELGRLDPNKTLDNLTPFERERLQAQMRLQGEISDALEKFQEAKRQYDEYLERIRASKTTSQISNQMEGNQR